MKNKLSALFLLLLCVLSIFGNIHAQELSGREEWKISVDNIRLFQPESEDTASIEQLLKGLTFISASQKEPVPELSLELSMGGTQVLTYELQSTTPYYVRTNFFGDDTYMIYPEDKFEEKIAEALYGILNELSDTPPDNLPPLEEIYASIQTIRDANDGNMAISEFSSIQLTETVDPSAFLPVIESITTRFVPADPLPEDHYLFTDIQDLELAYDWPESQSLPMLPTYANAVTAVFTSEDLLQLVNCLPAFFEANPELAEIISTSIEQQMLKNDPELTIPEGTDLLAQLVDTLRETVQTDLAELVLNLRVDTTQTGSVGLITLEIINDKSSSNPTVISYHTTDNEQNKVHEFAVDIISDGNVIPLLRTAAVSEQSETGANSFNLFFTDYGQNKFEAALQADTHINSLNTRFTDTRLRFNLNSEEGDLVITETGKGNRFDKEDTLAEITYEHTSQGRPAFNLSLTAAKTISDPLPALTPSDAVSVSEMTQEDYSSLVSNIFMNIMMLAFSFAD